MDKDDFEFSTKFQQFVDDGKWKEVKKFLTQYVVNYEDDSSYDLTKCYVVVFEVLKNE